MRSIYFDYNATTPLDPEVRGKMDPFFGSVYGNPSSIHHIGRFARAALDEARERVASVWSCKPSEVVFTSGGTESNNLAIFGVARTLAHKGKHLITTGVEHDSVLQSCSFLRDHQGFELNLIPVDSNGVVSVADLKSLLRPETILVSVLAANNETGTLQPFTEIGALCREHGVLFHVDAAQWFGKEPVSGIHQFNADLVTICGHKFHGPKGAGALFVRSPLQLQPLLFGGGHENEQRAGTENVPAIIGLAEAIARFISEPVFPTARLRGLTEQIGREAEDIPGVRCQGHPSNRLANTLAITAEGCDSISLLAGLDIEGICASSGSACSAGSLEPSHVLKAMGVPDHLANSFVRFSLGRDSQPDEVEYLLDRLPMIIRRIREQ